MGWLRTEVEGWKQALTDRHTLLVILVRLALAALCAAAGIVVGGHVDPALVVLGVVLAVLAMSLVWLRATGRP